MATTPQCFDSVDQVKEITFEQYNILLQQD